MSFDFVEAALEVGPMYYKQKMILNFCAALANPEGRVAVTIQDLSGMTSMSVPVVTKHLNKLLEMGAIKECAHTEKTGWTYQLCADVLTSLAREPKFYGDGYDKESV